MTGRRRRHIEEEGRQKKAKRPQTVLGRGGRGRRKGRTGRRRGRISNRKQT
jgi:hypothetical protein